MRKVCAVSFCFCMLISIQSVYAVKIKWSTTAINTLWDEPLNWDLARIPISTDSVYTFYTDHIDLPSNFIAEIKYMNLIGNLTIPADSELIFTNGRFDALGTLTNYGTIHVNNSPGVGLLCSTQAANLPFSNFGKIFIDNATLQGLLVLNEQVLTNEAGGLIEIQNSGLENLALGNDFSFGVLDNDGVIKMQTPGNGVGMYIKHSGSELNNLVCAKMVLFDQIIMEAGTLDNAGFFKQNYDGDNDFGDLAVTVINNHSTLEDWHGSFVNNDFDIQSIWVKEFINTSIKTGEQVSIFIKGTPVGINMGDIYTDNMLTINAGSYDLTSNIWIPNANANGNTTFFVRASLQSNTCFDTLRFELEFPVIAMNYWLGGTGAWQTAAKWSTGLVPVASERAAIYNSTDLVGINNSTVSIKEIYLGGQLNITSTGILNITGVGTSSRIYMEEGAITNNGVMNFKNGSIGLNIRNSPLINNNQISFIGLNASISISSFGGLTASLENNGVIESNAERLIDGDESVINNHGSLISYNPNFSGIDSDELYNYGTIYIEGDNMTGTGLTGIIYNLPTGTITLKKLSYGAKFSGENQGIITADLNGTGFEIVGGFTNMSGGQLQAKDCSKGLYIKDGLLTNDAGGILEIEKSTQYGIHMGNPSLFQSADIVNSGLITINETTGSGAFLESKITNKDNGILKIRESTAHGIHIQGAILKNEDQGLVDVKVSDSHAIFAEGGTVQNYDDALFHLDSAGMSGLYISEYIDLPFTYGGSMANYGKLVIGPTLDDYGILLEPNTFITNYECSGEIVCKKKILLDGDIYNYGIYDHLNSGLSVIGTNFQNYGIVHDPFSTLPLPNSWNDGFYFGKKPGIYDEGELINNIVLKDPTIPTNFEVDTAWYLNEELDVPAGIYDPLQNTFIPFGLAVDSSKFYFTVSNCNPISLDTFSLTLQNPINKVCGQIKWVGGKGTFSNVEKWDRYRLPGICDSVMVEGVMDSVLVNTSTPIAFDHMTNNGSVLLSTSADLTIKDNMGNGLLNDGLIINKGNLTIQNISMNGYIGSLNSNFTNEGTVMIKDILMRGMDYTGGVIHNKVGAIFTIENTTLEHIRLGGGAMLQQAGTMNLE